MGNVQHPLGHTMPDDHKQALMAQLNRRGVALVEDDVYAEVYFGRERPRPIKYWDTSGDSLLCSSFSKCLAPGFRVGWVVAGRHAERVQRLQLMSTLSTMCQASWRWPRCCARAGGCPLSPAAPTWPSASSRCRPPCCACCRGSEHLLPRWRLLSLAQEFDPRLDSRALHAQALASGFHWPRRPFLQQGLHNHCLRLNSSHPWSEQLEAALIRLAELIHQQLDSAPAKDQRPHDGACSCEII